MKMLYVSPFFLDKDGQGRKFMIPMAGLKTYQKRDACLVKMKEMGGIYAAPTGEFMKLHRQMMSAKRKIEREGWNSQEVVA